MGRKNLVAVSATDRQGLEAVAVNRNTPQKHAWRAQILLLLADGISAREVQRRTGASQPSIRRWRERFRSQGVDGLLRDKTRPPGKRPLPAETIRRVVE